MAKRKGQQTDDTRTRAHQVRFTDADWLRILEVADDIGISPTAYVNYATGAHLRLTDGGKWDGLLEHGGRREGSGRKKVKKVILDNQG